MKPLTAANGFHDWSYDELIDSMEFDEEIIREDDDDYSGNTYAIYRQRNSYGVLVFAWGSCSGCDALQGCSSVEEVTALRDQLHGEMRWFGDRNSLTAWLLSDHDLQWYGHSGDWKDFVGKAMGVLTLPDEVEDALASIQMTIQNKGGDMPDTPGPTEDRVTMIWPADLKNQVRDLAGKRGLTKFTLDAVRDSLRRGGHETDGELEQLRSAHEALLAEHAGCVDREEFNGEWTPPMEPEFRVYGEEYVLPAVAHALNLNESEQARLLELVYPAPEPAPEPEPMEELVEAKATRDIGADELNVPAPAHESGLTLEERLAIARHNLQQRGEAVPVPAHEYVGGKVSKLCGYEGCHAPEVDASHVRRMGVEDAEVAAKKPEYLAEREADPEVVPAPPPAPFAESVVQDDSDKCPKCKDPLVDGECWTCT